VLSSGPPWDEAERIVDQSLRRLNDFTGYRPVAVLETEQELEPYEHERLRPIPLYIRGAGVAYGPYEELIAKALDLLAAAQFDLDKLDELALDPRAYDFNHPVHQRPNYVFGEWDPHCIDNEGYYRRFVLRSITLETLTARVNQERNRSRAELLFEAAAVLAGVMLMASGVSGRGPNAYDSTVTLESLMPRIARYRDTFYERLLARLQSAHGERLRREAAELGQPFAGVRQHFNEYLARRRAEQLRLSETARLFALLGHPELSRKYVAVIHTTSARFVSEIYCSIVEATRLINEHKPGDALHTIQHAIDLVHRGIHCGALVDPWNILGFQAQFSLFPARENSVPDHRVHQLLDIMNELFDLLARAVIESASAGDERTRTEAQSTFRKLAQWWDRYATTEVSDLRRVHGGELYESAVQVAEAIAAWRQGGQATGDVAFWSRYEHIFSSPKAYAAVLDALMDQADRVAALALLMHWLSRAQNVPIESDQASFSGYMLRWMLETVSSADTREPAARSAQRPQSGRPAEYSSPEAPSGSADGPAWWRSVTRCFDYLEANAETYWDVPELHWDDTGAALEPTGPDDDNLFAAAYEGVIYRDSAQDGHEGETLGDEFLADFPLASVADDLAKRLTFLTTLGQLWQIAATSLLRHETQLTATEQLSEWHRQADKKATRLEQLVQAIAKCPMPQPTASADTLIEHNRNLEIKYSALSQAVRAYLEMRHAANMLSSVAGQKTKRPAPTARRHGWEQVAAEIQQALWLGQPDTVRGLMPLLLNRVSSEHITFVPLERGGDPARVIRAQLLLLNFLLFARSLPRLGLIEETLELLNAAHRLELQNIAAEGEVTEFDNLFRQALDAVIEAIVRAADRATPTPPDSELLRCVRQIGEPFFVLWVKHCQTLRISTIETVDERRWQKLCDFIRRYGAELITPRFVTPANLRALLDQGPPSGGSAT